MRNVKVLELLSIGNSQTEIAKTLQMDLSIVSRDTSFLRQQAKDNIRKYVDERLPEEYEKCLIGLNAIVKEAWNTSQQTQDKKGEDTSIISGQRMLWDEIGFTHKCYSG